MRGFHGTPGGTGDKKDGGYLGGSFDNKGRKIPPGQAHV